MINTPNGGKFNAFQFGTSGNSAHDIMTYWSPERKRAAAPAPMGFVSDRESPAGANAAPTTQPKQADLSKMPFQAGGKLFFTMDGVDYVASANIFMRNNLLLTAAHCIQDKTTGNLAENFAFERTYTGEISAESLTFKTVAVKENWYLEKDLKWDYAIAILTQNSTVATPLKYTTEDVTGRLVTSMGYPVSYAGGEQMMFVNGNLTSQPGRWILDGSQMGPGASGGAWVLEDNETAIGINSYNGTNGKTILYAGSPMFDAEFDQLYQYVLTLL